MMQTLRAAWRVRWSQASAREQTWVRIGVSVLLLAALWARAATCWTGAPRSRARARSGPRASIARAA